MLDAGCDSEHEIELVAEVNPHTVRIRVIDAGSHPPSRPRGASDLALGGVRLRVVQRLARRWGPNRATGCACGPKSPSEQAG